MERGRYGVTNKQMIPALQRAIAENSLEKLLLLKAVYEETFTGSIRYLKKAEREFMANHNF